MTFNEIFTTIEQGIQSVYDSEHYRDYLETLSRFPSYSLNNCILIARQKPEATFVAGYQTWKKKFSRNVRKGEKGIRILAPIRQKKQEEEKEEPKTILRFRVISVFDISQTEGEPLPTSLVSMLDSSVEDYEEFLEALELASPVPVRFQAMHSAANGYFDARERVIYLKQGMPQLQTIKTLLHECAHALMHSEAEDMSRAAMEVEAESVAYTVCRHYGLDTGSYSFGYLAAYSSSRELPELRASMERIHTASSVLIRNIDLVRSPGLAEARDIGTLADRGIEALLA